MGSLTFLLPVLAYSLNFVWGFCLPWSFLTPSHRSGLVLPSWDPVMTWPPSVLYYRFSGMPSLHTAVCLDCPHLGSSPLALLVALCWAPACSPRSLNSLFVFTFLLPPGLEPIPYIPAVIEILLQIKQTLWIHLNASSLLHPHEMEGLRSPYWLRVSFSCSTL